MPYSEGCKVAVAKWQSCAFLKGAESATRNPQLFLILLWRACVRMRTLYIYNKNIKK